MKITDTSNNKIISSTEEISFLLKNQQDIYVKFSLVGGKNSPAYYDEITSQVESAKENEAILSAINLYKDFGKINLRADFSFSADNSENKDSYVNIRQLKFDSDYFNIEASGNIMSAYNDLPEFDLLFAINKYANFTDFLIDIFSVRYAEMLAKSSNNLLPAKLTEKQKNKLKNVFNEIPDKEENDISKIKFSGKMNDEIKIGRLPASLLNEKINAAIIPDKKDLKKLQKNKN